MTHICEGPLDSHRAVKSLEMSREGQMRFMAVGGFSRHLNDGSISLTPGLRNKGR